MTHVAIAYHSGYGHTKRLTEAVASGAREAGAEVSVLAISAEGELDDAAWQTLAAADAIILGTPTYMGGPSWQFKRFADASSKVWGPQAWRNKIMAGYTNSATMNGDKLSTLHYLFTLAMQQGGVWVGTGIMPSNTKAATRNDINYVGSFSGLMAQSPSDSSAEEGPPQGDLDTAKLFARRVVETAQRWNKG